MLDKNDGRGVLQCLILLGASIFWTSSFACYVPPAEQVVTPAQQLAASQDVTLARVISAEPMSDLNVRFRFEVIQRFSGIQRSNFEITGRASIDAAGDQSFNNHTDPNFWKGYGRTTNDTDCQIHPDFSLGKVYLIFLNQPYTRKSFELIELIPEAVVQRDRWLMYVQRHFGLVYRKRLEYSINP
jgi:hypothetical protein